MNTQKEKINAAIKGTMAIAEAIREVKQVPSGTLYANLCGVMSIDQFSEIVKLLERAKVIENRSNLLVWIA